MRERTPALLMRNGGPHGGVAFPGAIPARLDDGVVGEGFQVDVFNVLGAGDAFMAGFLRGWLRDEPLDTCCSYANACGAIVAPHQGCSPGMPPWDEHQDFLSPDAHQLQLPGESRVAKAHLAHYTPPTRSDL